MVLAATCMWGVNGTVSKAILGAGLSSPRLTEVRSTGAALALAVALAVTQPWRLRIRRSELLFLGAFGIFGLALVQWFYFFAIHRLQIGIALLIQYLAPVLIALWATVRDEGARPAANLGRAHPLARGPVARRRPLARVQPRRPRRRRVTRRGGGVRALHPARRARGSSTATRSRSSASGSRSPRSSGPSSNPGGRSRAGSSTTA